MRDASALQRRRRLMLLKNVATSVDDVADAAHPDAASIRAVDSDDARRRLLQECRGQIGLQLIVEVSGEAHPRKWLLDQPFAVIGSDDQCDFRIDHPEVLSQHVYLQWIDGRLFCSGLGSSKSQSVTAWIDRKPVTVGPLRLSVSEIAPVSTSSTDPQSRSTELATDVPQVQLKFAGVEQRDNFWPVDRSLTLIGRGPQCKLRLDHPEIPIVFASLVRTAGSCWLINLSRNASLQVNDQPILLQSLDIGDALQLAAFRAEVSTAPFSKKTNRQVASGGPKGTDIRELATRHRQKLGVLNKSLDAVQVYLDSDHLDAIPELKTALQQYILHAQRHHREVQEALERLS